MAENRNHGEIYFFQFFSVLGTQFFFPIFLRTTRREKVRARFLYNMKSCSGPDGHCLFTTWIHVVGLRRSLWKLHRLMVWVPELLQHSTFFRLQLLEKKVHWFRAWTLRKKGVFRAEIFLHGKLTKNFVSVYWKMKSSRKLQFSFREPFSGPKSWGVY